MRVSLVFALTLFLCAAASAQVQGPTTRTVRDSLRDRVITNISNETGRPTQWTFDRSELIEVDVINTTRVGRRWIVLCDIKTADAPGIIRYADRPSGRTYVPTGTVEGRLRLTYESFGGSFDLREIENVTLRATSRTVEFRDISSQLAAIPSAPPAETQMTLVNQTFHVKARGWVWFNFNVNRQSRVYGTFVAQGGGRNNIQGLIMTQNEFVNWQNSNQNLAYYRSGNVTIGQVDIRLNPGSYVIVFYNDDLFTGKTVAASIYGQ